MTAAPPRPRRIFVSAGEVSGDIVAAKVIEAVRAADPSAVVEGIGGPRMAGAGAALIASATHIGAVGVSEGLATAPAATRIGLAALRHCRAHRPDVALLVANDVFNVIFGRLLRARGIPTVSLFPPQTWIWGSIAKLIAPSFDLVLASFREEAECYGKAGVPTEFVGHYLADVLGPATPEQRTAARATLGLASATPVVALLPGSRRPEVARLLPIMLAAADEIRREAPAAQFVAALQAPASAAALRTPGGHPVSFAPDSHTLMRAADVVLSCSGTATLEGALVGIPMVIAYQASWITYRIVRLSIRARRIREETVGLPNLLVGRHIVPELLQRQVTAPALASAGLSLLKDGGRRQAMLDALREVRARVACPGSIDSIARITLAWAGA